MPLTRRMPRRREAADALQGSPFRTSTRPLGRATIPPTGWRSARAVLIVAAMFLGVGAPALASSPQLDVILPRGVQRGMQHELVFQGARLADAQEVFLYEPGVTVAKIEVVDASSVKVTVDVAADCRLGEHLAQIRAASGVSEFRSFFVSALPTVAETEPNDAFTAPQRIESNVTVRGICRSEDIDYYVVTAKQGGRLSVEVEGMRLGTTFFDPYIAILDAERFELAAADDTSLGGQDGHASIVVPADGDYVIVIRDTAYQGNDASHYALHVGNFPRPTVVYPAGGPAGQAIDVQFLGDPTGPIAAQATAPASPVLRSGIFAEDGNGISPSPVAFRPFGHGNVLEQEPNNAIAEATAAELPLAFNGVIGAERDVDFFKFNAKQGEVWDIECFARRLRSGLDPVINLFGPDGKHIVGNDDSRGLDSYLRWQVPADGEYSIRVMDHLRRGQADFVYRLELTNVQPKLLIAIPRVQQYSQYRQSIVVPRGGRFGTLIVAARTDFGGPITLDASQLPEGVTMTAPPMSEGLSLMPVVFEAREDAPIGGKLVDWRGSHATNPEISGGYINVADFVLGPPNNSVFLEGTVDKVPMAVVEKLPFTLEIVQPNVPLVRDGSAQLKVLVHRAEGFDQPIHVEFPFRPPGVGTVGAIQIPQGVTEAYYPLNANADAQLGDWPVYVIGMADVGGQAWTSSQLATLKVAERLVVMDVARTSCEQGQEAHVYCKLNHLAPFDGTAKAELIGLPPHATVEPIEFTKDTQEVTFVVKTTPETPVGQHKSLFTQITITTGAESSVSVGGRSELQVDAPLPTAVAAAPAEQPAAAPAEPAARPLSRLEKLREQSRGSGTGSGS